MPIIKKFNDDLYKVEVTIHNKKFIDTVSLIGLKLGLEGVEDKESFNYLFYTKAIEAIEKEMTPEIKTEMEVKVSEAKKKK